MDNLKEIVDISMGRVKADLVLKNAYIVNVFTQSIEKNDVAIYKEKIVGIGKYDGVEEIDCTGQFVCPGFIDSHVHIESTLVTPEVFSHLMIKNGVTTAVVDPHEIANVLGEKGIEFMLHSSKKSVMDLLFMLPSCVPATPFEDNGATLDGETLSKYIKEEEVLGLGEVMDVPSVIGGNPSMLKKLEFFNEKNIDGHCPSIGDKELNAYLSCGIKTDHECATYEEAIKKVNRGMYVMLREGSATRNVKDLLPAVNKENFGRFLFCTDDKHIDHVIEEGTIDNSIRLSIKLGLEPIMAITIATLNAANCFNLKNKGAVAPGYIGDLVIFEDLKEIKIKKVIKGGKLYKGEITYEKIEMPPSMNLNVVNKEMFKVEAKGKRVNVIKLVPRSVETRREMKKVEIKDGYVEKVLGENILKIGVFERHKRTGKYSIGYIEGLGLKNCAIAQTIAHDSHNVIVVGDNDKDMEVAVNSLITVGGGIVIASGGKLLDYLSLPIGGIMTSEDPEKVKE